jgi:hypothetical protein
MDSTIGTKSAPARIRQCRGPGELPMQRYVFLFALLFVPCVLTACSYAEDATLFNNTSGEVRLELQGNKTVLSVSGHAKINLIVGYARTAHLFSGACEYVYDVPLVSNYYRLDRKLDRGIQMQVEKDFSINLLPGNYASDTPSSAEMFLKREGFPLKPVSRKCQ